MTTDTTVLSEILFGSNPRHSIFIRQNLAHAVALGLVQLESYDFDKVMRSDGTQVYCLDLSVRKYTSIALTRVIEIYAHIIHGVIPRNNKLSDIWFPTPYPDSRLLGTLPCDLKYLQNPLEARRLLYTIGTKDEVRAAHTEAAQILLSVTDALDYLYLHTANDPSYPWRPVISREEGPLIPGTIQHYAEVVCDQHMIDACDQQLHGLDNNSDDRFFLELWGPDNNFHINRPEVTQGYWAFGQEFTPVEFPAQYDHFRFDSPLPDVQRSQYWGACEANEEEVIRSKDLSTHPDSPQSVVVPGFQLNFSPLSDSSLSMSTSFSLSSSDDSSDLFDRSSPPVTRSKASSQPLQLIERENGSSSGGSIKEKFSRDVIEISE